MKVLVIDDEKEIAEILKDIVSEEGHAVTVANDGPTALDVLSKNSFDLVFSDIHMPGYNGIEVLEKFNATKVKRPRWVFISADASNTTITKVVQLGAEDCIQKPFDAADVVQVLSRVANNGPDPLLEIMKMVQDISGVQLGPEKRLLVETRVMRRARQLGMNSVDSYVTYFKQNKDAELKEVVSVVTTHTTEFFRESDHFDFLFDKVFPQMMKKPKVRIWSAASSTGEEAYSLAISYFEFLREKGIDPKNAPQLEVFGTDIDFNSVEKAKTAIYQDSALTKLNQKLIARYFDVGTGDLKGKFRLKDFIHKNCKFEQMNLLDPIYRHTNFDVIFLRNVLIYFKPSDVEQIAIKMQKSMDKDGFLFLGHSESITGLNVGCKSVGNSIYQQKAAAAVTAAAPMASASSPLSSKPIRVFVVDDSLTIRSVLKKMLTKAHGFEVVAEAANPIEAEKIRKGVEYDLMTLDIHMPEMDGISYLEKLKNEKVPPIVMISSISYEDATGILHCLEGGAVDYIEKPAGLNLDQEAERIRSTLKAAVQTKKIKRELVNQSSDQLMYKSSDRDLILIGASTGGVEAITAVLTQFPANSPPILIVQHIPAQFSKVFADRLNSICKIKVFEGSDGMAVQPGQAIVAPGGKQMGIVQKDGKLFVKITDDEPVNRHRPSVDYLFMSVVELKLRYNMSCAILTGMGGDGAKGLKALRDMGAHTIAQNEETCVVYGMPQEAVKLNAAKEVLPLMSISYHLLKSLQQTKAA